MVETVVIWKVIRGNNFDSEILKILFNSKNYKNIKLQHKMFMAKFEKGL